MVMRALVTGATGFVGSHVVEALVTEGHEVRALFRETSDKRWIKDLPVTWCLGDLRDQSSLLSAMENVDWVFHVAGVTKASGYASYVAANTEGTRRVFEACLQQKHLPRKVILVSSLGAAGPCSPESPKQECDPCQPVSHYGLSKLQAERIALSFADRITVVVVRPPAVYGPRDRDILALFRLVNKRWYLSLGRGERYICMLHVADLVQGVLLAARADVSSGAIFFLSDGEIHTWGEIVAILERIMGVRVRRVNIPIPLAFLMAVGSEVVCRVTGSPPLLNRQKMREMLQRGWTCDIQQAVDQLQFRPKVRLEVGLKETLNWYRQQRWL
jgi:dihydroflavonol-4-reductase